MIGNFFQLSDYLQDLRDKLHDPQSQYWQKPQLIRYINEGLRRRDLDTGQNRVQYPFVLTVNQDAYSLFDVAAQNPEVPHGPTDVTATTLSTVVTFTPPQILGYQVLAAASWETTVTVTATTTSDFGVTYSTPAPLTGGKLYWQLVGGSTRPNASRVFDIVSMNLLYNNVRVVMGAFSLTELNASVRQYMPPLSWAPVRWARYGPFGIIVAPAPSTPYQTEWDCCTISAPLVNDADCDLLPYPYTTPVCYYAAYKAKLNERQFDEADAFFQQYSMQVQTASNQRIGMVPNMYSSDMTRL